MDNTKIKSKLFNIAGTNFFLYSLASISLSICLVHIKKDLHFSFTQAGLFAFICAIEQMFILFISPIFAAKFGKIKVLKFSVFILAVGLICFSQSINFITALLSSMCMGIGFANMEALLTPLANDLFPKQVSSKMNRLHAFWSLGSFSGLIGLGFFLSIGIVWRVLYLALAFFALLLFILYPSSKKITLPSSDASLNAFKKIFKRPAFWLFGFALFFEGGAEGAFTFWAATLVQIHLKGSAFYAGLITASFAFGMMFGRFTSSKILRKYSVPKTLIISSTLAFLISLSFGFINSLWSLGLFLFLMGTTLACLWPTIQSYASVILPVDPTALMIFLSCFGVPGYSTSSLIMGAIADKYNLFMAFITVVPVFSIMVPVLFLIACKIAIKNNKNG